MERYTAYKDSGVDWIGEIPTGWTATRLKQVSSARRGSGLKRDDLLSEGRPCVRYGELYTTFKQSIDAPRSFVSQDQFDRMTLAHPCDLVMALTGETKEDIGPAAFNATGQDLAVGGDTLILSNLAINHRFLTYSLNSDYFKQQKHQLANGDIIVHLGADKVINGIVLLPSIFEQAQIADFLDAKTAEIDALIVQTERSIGLLNEYRKSVISEAVAKGLESGVPMKASGIDWIGDIPEHWNVHRVKISMKRQSTTGVPEEQVLSLYRDLGVVIKASRDDNHNTTSEDTSTYRFVEPDDLVVNKMKAWQGSLAVSRFRGIVSPAYYVYRITDNIIEPRYLHHLLRNQAYLPEYRRLSGGIRPGQWDLSAESFENIPMLVPPTPEQVAIADFLDAKTADIEAQVESRRALVERLREYRQSLISECVTGKVKVPGVS